MSRPIPNVTLGGFRPNQVKINSIGIGIDDDTLNSLNLNTDQYMVVGAKTNDEYSLIVDSEGVIINSSIVNRAAHQPKPEYGDEYALFIDGNIFVTGKVDTSDGTLSNVAGSGGGSGCNTYWASVKNDGSGSTNIFYDGKINIANEVQSRSNAYRVNIVDNANRTISHAQLAIQNQVGGIARMGILGYSNYSPVIINSSKGAIEFHANRDSAYFNSIYYRSNQITHNIDPLNIPYYASNSVAPHLTIQSDGNVGIKASLNPPLTYTLRTVDNVDPHIIVPTIISNSPVDLHVNGSTFSCNILIFDYESATQRNIDDLYVRRLGVTFAASQVEPGSFAPGDYTFLSNVSIGGPIESGCNLTVYGKVHIYEQLYADKAVLSYNLTIQNAFEVLGTSYFQNQVIVNDNLQVNENLIIWGGFYADSNALYTFVPDGNSNTTAPISFISYTADGWSNIYPQGAGFVTPGVVGIGINYKNYTSNDQTPSQLNVISRDANIYALSLMDKTDPTVTKALFVGHQRSNIINDVTDASVIFSTPSSTSPYFTTTAIPKVQNMYFYPGQYDKTTQNMVNNANPPVFSIYETKQVAINSFQPNLGVQLHVNGSVGFTSNLYTYDKNGLIKLANFKYGVALGDNNTRGISYIDNTAPHIGFNRIPHRNYGVSLQGGLLADTYYTTVNQEGRKGYLWLDSATNNNDTDPSTTSGMYILSKVGIGRNTPDYLLDLCGDNPNIGNNYGTYIRLGQSTLEGMSNMGIRFDGSTNPWFTNVESVSTNVSRYAIGSAPSVYDLVNTYNTLRLVTWTSNYNNNYANTLNTQSEISYSGPITYVSSLTSNSSNIINTSNFYNTYNIQYISNITSNITSNIWNIPNIENISYNIIYDYTSKATVNTQLYISTSSNYNTPLSPTLSNIEYTSNTINTSNITYTSNIYYAVNTSNYLYSSNNNGILVQYNASKGLHGHQVVIGGNSYLLDNSIYNPNPNSDAILTVNGDTSIIGNLNVSGYISANNTIEPVIPGRDNVPSIEQDDLFISGKDVYINSKNKIYLNYTCNLRDAEEQNSSQKAVLNVYQDINTGGVPPPILHLVGESDNPYIEIISQKIALANPNASILRFGIINGDINKQTIGFQDGAGIPYFTIQRITNKGCSMGINTDSPDAQFHIINNNTLQNDNNLRITFDNGSGADTAEHTPNIVLDKKYTENNNTNYKQWIIEGPTYGTGLNDQLSFKYNKIIANTTTSKTILSITSNGCIGINNINPRYSIDIIASNVDTNHSDHGIRLWNKTNTDIAQLIFQSGDTPELGQDIYTDYIMYSCNNDFVFKQRNSSLSTNPLLLYFNSNTNIGIRTEATDSYNVNVKGTLNISDSIYVNGKLIYNSADYVADGYAIYGSNNVYINPSIANYGGVVINGTIATSNLFHIFNDGTNSPNMTVYDSVLNSAEVYFRNKSATPYVYNLYKMYTSDNNFGFSYQNTYNLSRPYQVPTSGWSNIFNVTAVSSTNYKEHDMTLNGTLTLQSDIRGLPKISFGSSGEIGGNNTYGSLYLLAGSSSNVGIGTTVPNAPLHVNGNTYMGQGLTGSHATTVGGPFFKQQSWDNIGNMHTITYPDYCVGENSTGMIYIQISNKSTNPANIKLGNIQVSFLKPYGNNVIINEVANHKNTNLSTLTVNTSSDIIIINTDNDCYISWTSIGSY